MNDFKLGDLSKPPYGLLKSQLVTHAVHNLLGEPYDPILEGVTSIALSSRISTLFRKYGIAETPTANIGSCGLLLHDLVPYTQCSISFYFVS